MSRDRRLTEEVRALAVREGGDLVGIAPAAALADVEPGQRPREYMPSARCVVSIAVHIPHGVCDVWGEPGDGNRTAGPYLLYGYGVTSWEVSRISLLVARHLELAGYRSICFPPAWSSSYYRSYHLRAEGVLSQDFPHQAAAVAAGLGELGLSRLCLTPEFGARQRFGSVLTDAPLTTDEPYSGPSLCRPEECGRRCLEDCPARALDDSAMERIKVGEREHEVARLDGVRCLYGLEGLIAGSGSRTKVGLAAGPGVWSELVAAREERHSVDRLLLSHSAGALVGSFCERCLHQCPAHRWQAATGP